MKQELELQISRFKSVIAMQFPSAEGRNLLGRALRKLYAVKTANAVLEAVASLFPNEIEIARTIWLRKNTEDSCPSLPTGKAIRGAARALLAWVESGHGHKAAKALEDMGVLLLCHSVGGMLNWLDQLNERSFGRARLILCVEMAIFAAELGANERAASYLSEARNLEPRPPELHDIHTVEGVLALRCGDTIKAKKCLIESARVCNEGQIAQIMCRIREVNLMLAISLMECGEQNAVVEFLAQCRRVWRNDRDQIGLWTDAARRGETAVLRESGLSNPKNIPTIKIRELTRRGSVLADLSDETALGPGEGSHLRVEEILAASRREAAEAIRGKLKTSRN